MHHPKEAIIDGVKFVLIPEELLMKVTSIVTDLVEGGGVHYPTLEEVATQLEAL